MGAGIGAAVDPVAVDVLGDGIFLPDDQPVVAQDLLNAAAQIEAVWSLRK